MAYNIPVFFLAFIGILLLAPIRKGKNEKRINVAKTVRASKRARIVSEKAPILVRFRENILLAIEQAGIRLSWDGYLVLCFVTSLLGTVAGAFMQNVPLSVVLALILPLIATQYIKIRSLSYKAYLYMQIEDSLSTITSTYMQSENIGAALYNCLERIDAPLKDILSDCATEIYIGVHPADAIMRMRARVNNRSWRQWCDTLIQCQSDRSRMVLLPPLVQEIASIRQAQSEREAETARIWRDHIAMCLIALGAVPFIKLLNADWHALLTGTIVGKCTIAFVYGVVGIATLYAARVNKPISMEVT